MARLHDRVRSRRGMSGPTILDFFDPEAIWPVLHYGDSVHTFPSHNQLLAPGWLFEAQQAETGCSTHTLTPPFLVIPQH